MLENKVKEYLSQTSKEVVIDLYLQMRFERDLYEHMYNELYKSTKIKDKGKDKGWTLDDLKVKYGYELAREEFKDRGGCWGCLCDRLNEECAEIERHSKK